MGEFQFLKSFPKLEDDELNNLSFFFQPDFAYRNGKDNLRCYIIQKDSTLCAYIYFSIKGNIAVSLANSPYGGIVTFIAIKAPIIEQFIEYIIKDFKKEGLKIVEIRNSPKCYGYHTFEESILKMGFDNVCSDINQHIEIEKKTFPSKLNSDKKYRLNRCKKSNFHSRELLREEFKDAFFLIEGNMNRKKYPLTLSYDLLEQSINSFPNRYIGFGVYNHQLMIAAIISVKVDDAIIYNFYHGYSQEYMKYSPLVLALEYEYEYAYIENFKQIDLGISSVNGICNEGLFHFKKAIGGVKGEKNSFRYKI
ncbi:MAG: hypothetical protein OEW67_07055 [Cyclobacteriaceae bacterium]|nr:hypothetical protein [Cyclobacteriaceae bacterium]